MTEAREQLPAANPVPTESSAHAEHIPLCVDMDGTLLETDSFIEAVAVLLRQQPMTILLLPIWLLRGVCNLKAQVHKRVDLDVQKFKFNSRVLQIMKQACHKRPVILISGAMTSVVATVAKRVGTVHAYYGSSDQVNLTGQNKRILLEHLFGERSFDYIGNAKSDLAVWGCAREAYLVNTTPKLRAKARKFGNVAAEYDNKDLGWRTFARQMRTHQWAKNALIFMPLFLAGKWDLVAFANTILAFLSFSLMASAGYVFNDVLDIRADRNNLAKSTRPLAKGDIPLHMAPLLMGSLVIGAILIALMTTPGFLAMVLGYLALTLVYSLKIKRIAVADVIVLSGFYTYRIFAGGEAADIDVSWWLSGFSTCFFLSLAFIKRSSELEVRIRSNREATVSRGYVVHDQPLLRIFGAVSGFSAVGVLLAYGSNPGAMDQYQRPVMLWVICLLLCYWIIRYWIIANRGMMDSDPVKFAVRDKVSYLIVTAIALCWLLARGLP